jgi:transcription initiation factor TFIID subunit 2
VDESPPDDVDKDMLVVDETDADMEAKKALIARTTSVEGAVKALKEEFQNNEVFKVAIWEAIKSRRINAWEQLNYLEICTIFYHAADNMVLRLPYPRYWKAKHLGKVYLTPPSSSKVHITNYSQGKIRFRQTEKIRTKPIQKWEPAQPVKPVITIPLPKPNPISLPHKVHSPAPARTPTIKLGTPAPSAPTSSYAPPTMQPPKRPAPSSFAQQPSRTPQQPSRPRKIVKLRLASEKLLKFPKGRSGPPRSSLSSSSRPSPVPSNTRPSPSPSINMSRPSPNPSPGYIGTAVQRDSTPSTPGVGAGGKIRVPLPGAGRHPLPTTPATGTPLASQTPNGTGNAANGLTQKKPSLKLKLSFTKKPAS